MPSLMSVTVAVLLQWTIYPESAGLPPRQQKRNLRRRVACDAMGSRTLWRRTRGRPDPRCPNAHDFSVGDRRTACSRVERYGSGPFPPRHLDQRIGNNVKRAELRGKVEIVLLLQDLAVIRGELPSISGGIDLDQI